MTVQIDKIVIEIDGEKIKLSLAQAKELQQVLDETLGKKEPSIFFPYPIIIERPFYRREYTWWTVSTDNTSAITYSLAAENGY